MSFFRLVLFFTILLSFGVSLFGQKNVYDFGNNISSIDNIIKEEISKNTKVDIVHIGDSHVQSGFFSDVIRQAVQKKYGTAGRGLVCMHNIYRSNDASDIVTKTISGNFIGYTVSRQNLKNPVSLSAIELNAVPNTQVSISIKSRNTSFKNIVVIRSKNSSELICANTKSFKPSNDMFDYWVKDTIVLEEKTNIAQLNSNNTFSDRNYAGLYLYNNDRGVVFNSIGVNGATFDHFNSRDYFGELSKLSPKVIIISLGTNDGYTTKFDVFRFRNNLEMFAQNIEKVFPNVPVVFTTPPPSCIKQYYKTKRKRRRKIRYANNPNIKIVSSEIVECAKKHGFAVIDLYSILDGEKGIPSLISTRKLGKDRVHYTIDGYNEHGRIVAKSLGF